ncbi:MAG: VWA domain-containing protein [Planctomycetota bacterium]|nr:VWA domain-containing protein [Planctomycetota bacterium]
MNYSKKISCALPGLIFFLLDDSLSMAELMFGTQDAKYLWVERYLGILFKHLLGLSTDVSGPSLRIKPRYHVCVIVYGTTPEVWGPGVMDIETAMQRYADAGNSLGLGGKHGGTDAEAAMRMAHQLLQQALSDSKFQQSFPPMLLHLSDGESQSDATAAAEQIKQLTTSDGNVLVVNAYIGTQTSLSYTGPEDFPGYLSEAEAGPSPDNIKMFNMSSVAPDAICANLKADGIFPRFRDGARLFLDVRTKEALKHSIQLVSSIGSRVNR